MDNLTAMTDVSIDGCQLNTDNFSSYDLGWLSRNIVSRYDSCMWLVTQLTRKVDYLEHFSLTMLIVKWPKVTRNKSAFNSFTIS